jgi:hypothetical protein
MDHFQHGQSGKFEDRNCRKLKSQDTMELDSLKPLFLQWLTSWVSHVLLSADHFHPLNLNQDQNCHELKSGDSVTLDWFNLLFLDQLKS